MHKRIRKALGMAMLAVCVASPAAALSIRNLSGEAQVLRMERGGAAMGVNIANGQTLHFTGAPYWITVAGSDRRAVQARFDEEYILWPSGKLIIQKRQKVKGRR